MPVLRLWAAAAAAALAVTPAFGQVNIGANFQTMKLTDFGSSLTPPDTTGSVGPSQFMQYNNGHLTYFNKDGSTAKAGQSESSFWQAAGIPAGLANTVGGDPRLQFDPLSGRWFATAFTMTLSGGYPTANNTILIARSNTSNPAGSWTATSFAATAGSSLGLWADFPTLGFDKNGVYIGTNNFTPGNPNVGGEVFQNLGIFSIPKADLLQTTPSLANMTRFDAASSSTYGFAVQGVTNFNLGQTTSTPAQMLAISTTSYNRLRFFSASGTSAAGVTLGAVSNVTINSPAPPNPPEYVPAVQPNSTNTATSTTTIDALDDRYYSRVYRVGTTVFAIHNASISNRARLVVSVLNGTTNALITEVVLGETNFDYYLGSVAANARGDVVVGFTRSGFISSGNANNRWPSAYAVVGTFNGSTLTFGTPVELRTGNAEWLGTTAEGSINPKRWGDYSATNVDPADPGIFWTTQEFANASRDWGTQASEIIPTVTGEKRWASISSSNAAGITGNFSTAANWYNGAAPASTDHVIFSRNGDGSTAYTVSFAGTTAVDRASVRQGNVVWSIPAGAAFNLTNNGTGASDASGNVTSAASLAVADYLGTANLTVGGGGTLNTVTTTIAAGLNSESSANISSGSLTISGAGTAWVNSQSAYVGGNSSVAGGSGSLTVTGGAAGSVAGNLVVYNRAAGLTANTVTVGAGSTLTASGLTNPGAGTVVPAVTLSAASSQLVISGGSGTTFGGTVGGAGSLTKSNAGTFTLTAANTYTGPTTVSGGTLALSGSGSVAASPTLTVGPGATLGVSGVTGGANFDAGTSQFALAGGQTLRGTGTVDAGVTARPGSGIRGDVGTGTGTLTVNGTVILQGASGTGGATLTTVVSDNGTATPTRSNLSAANLNLVIDAVNKFNLILAAGANPLFTLGQQYTAHLATAAGAIEVNGVAQPANAVIDPSWYDLAPQGLILDPSYQMAVDSTGHELTLTFTPVPEPATVLAVAAAGLGLAGVARRKRPAQPSGNHAVGSSR